MPTFYRHRYEVLQLLLAFAPSSPIANSSGVYFDG